MNPRRTRVTSTLAAAALPVALLAGCSGDEPEPKFPDESSSSPTVASPSAPFEPTPPAAMERGDEAGAKAFVEYYFAMLNYAQRTGDVAGARRLALNECAACAGALDVVTTTYGAGGSIRGGVIDTLALDANYEGSATAQVRNFSAQASVRTQRQVVQGSSVEKYNGTYPGDRVRMQFLLEHSPEGWHIIKWSVL